MLEVKHPPVWVAKGERMDTLPENWAASEAYEWFMGRWSRQVAALFLKWLNYTPNQRWLDVGCGTGALTRTILSSASPQLMVGLDPSFAFVRYAHQQSLEASFVVGGAGSLAVQDKTFDNVVSGLALNFFPQPEQALLELQRIVKPGGLVAAYVWDYAGKMEFLRYFWDAALELDANAAAFHEGRRFPVCQPEPLRELWQKAGFHDVVVEALDISTRFDTFESYWQPFTVGNFPAPKYAMALAETQRARLRERLRRAVPTANDGSINLIARAWAVRGYRVHKV
jgi:ubiquinone/menaquinone biosynthesis C-methylase UbiE